MTPRAWPSVLVDEDVPVRAARVLRERGLSTVDVSAEEPLRGADDGTVVDYAAARDWVVISHNQRDRASFRAHVLRWRGRGNDSLCVLFLPRDLDDGRLVLRALLLLDWYAACPLPKPETLIWNDAAQALIHGHRPPSFTGDEIRYALGRLSLRPGGHPRRENEP